MQNGETYNEKTAVYFFCNDPDKDPVAPGVFKKLQTMFPLHETSIEIDGMPVLLHEKQNGERFFVVRTLEVLSHDYPSYLLAMNEHFNACAFAGIVNWHEGGNAPEAIFTIHTTGDIPSGTYGVADPKFTRAILMEIERSRAEVGLESFSSVTEATHWGGIPHGGSPGLILEYPVPVLDIEIGSSPASWSHEAAAEVLARALVGVFDRVDHQARPFVYVGGVHFEPSCREAVFTQDDGPALAPSHILANQWVVTGDYGSPEGADKLRRCLRSIRGGVNAVVFHDKLKGTFKSTVRAVAEEFGVPALSHKKLRHAEVRKEI